MDDFDGLRRDLALSELLDRVLNRGVVVAGELTISIADVDLIYVGLKVLLSSVETAQSLRHPACSHADEGDHAASLRDH